MLDLTDITHVVYADILTMPLWRRHLYYGNTRNCCVSNNHLEDHLHETTRSCVLQVYGDYDYDYRLRVYSF